MYSKDKTISYAVENKKDFIVCIPNIKKEQLLRKDGEAQFGVIAKDIKQSIFSTSIRFCFYWIIFVECPHLINVYLNDNGLSCRCQMDIYFLFWLNILYFSCKNMRSIDQFVPVFFSFFIQENTHQYSILTIYI